MSVSLSIKNAPQEVVDRLRARAARNHRSLQGELLSIISAAAAEPVVPDYTALVRRSSALGVGGESAMTVEWLREDRDR